MQMEPIKFGILARGIWSFNKKNYDRKITIQNIIRFLKTVFVYIYFKHVYECKIVVDRNRWINNFANA